MTGSSEVSFNHLYRYDLWCSLFNCIMRLNHHLSDVRTAFIPDALTIRSLYVLLFADAARRADRSPEVHLFVSWSDYRVWQTIIQFLQIQYLFIRLSDEPAWSRYLHMSSCGSGKHVFDDISGKRLWMQRCCISMIVKTFWLKRRSYNT